jgi:hypothetical protein
LGREDSEQLITKNKEKGKENQEMTRVATIDTRRVLHLVVIAAMVIATLLAAMIPTVVLADDAPGDNVGTTGGSFQTSDNSSPPSVISVELKNTDNSTAATMDPTVEYMIQVSITDNQTLEHLASLQVTLWCDSGNNTAPGVANNQTCAIITWDNTSTFTLTPMPVPTTWIIGPGASVQPTLTNNTGTFEFHFTPGKVATESAGALNWDIYAYALDEGSEEGDLYLRNQVMNWYGEINDVHNSAGFGSVALGAEKTSNLVHATYISNGNYSEQAWTESTWTKVGYDVDLQISGAPGNGEFALWVNDDGDTGAETQLTDAPGDIDAGKTITVEAGDPNSTMYLYLTLGPSGIASGTYSGNIYFGINNP